MSGGLIARNDANMRWTPESVLKLNREERVEGFNSFLEFLHKLKVSDTTKEI